MFQRSSKNKGNHQEVAHNHFKEYAHLSDADKEKNHKELAELIFTLPRSTSEERLKFRREILRLVHLYPQVMNINTPFLPKKPTREEYIITLTNDPISTQYLRNSEDLTDNLFKIEKIMLRYKTKDGVRNLNFDEAFDFFLLSDQLREDFKYGGLTDSKLRDVISKMTNVEIMRSAKKVCLSDAQLSAIFPAPMNKMACSEAKGIFKDAPSLFDSVGEFISNAGRRAYEMDNCVTKYKERAISFTK